MRTTIAIAIAAALALTGCITNIAGLKESAEDTGEALEQTAEALNQTADALDRTTAKNSTQTVSKPPVARISIFGGNGALLFKSTFQAEDVSEIILIDAKTKLSLIAGDSEAVEPGATLTSYAWTLDGKPIEGGRQANLELAEPALHTLTLTVTDSKGKTDTQSLKLGVKPEPYEVVTELATGPIVGAEGEGQSESLAWELAAPEKPAKIQSVVITAAPPVQCDAILELLDGEGTSVGFSDNAGHTSSSQTEEITLGEIPFAAYSIRVAPFACVADTIPVTVVVTFLPIVEGLEGGDGHGHAH